MFSMAAQLTARQSEVLAFITDREARGNTPPTYREICQRFGYKSTKAAADHVAALERKGLVSRERGRARGLRLTSNVGGLPLVGVIPAGMPRDAFPHWGEALAVDPRVYGVHDPSKAYAIRVTGDSMLGRQICDGDIVVMEKDAIPRHGDIVAALLDNEVTLKTFVREGSKVWLRAENPNCRLVLLPVMELRIQGVARGILRILSK